MDTHVAIKVLASPTLTKQERGSLLIFLTQGIWTKARAKDAGYDIDTQCECGAAADGLRHRLFQCPISQEERDRALSPDEQDLIQHGRDPLLKFGFQIRPDFNVCAPCGTGLADCQFWCDDPNVTLEEAFAGPVYVDGSCDNSIHLAYHAAGWAVVSMKDGKPYAILSGQVGDLYTQCSGVAEMLAVIAACTISPLVTEVHTDN